MLVVLFLLVVSVLRGDSFNAYVEGPLFTVFDCCSSINWLLDGADIKLSSNTAFADCPDPTGMDCKGRVLLNGLLSSAGGIYTYSSGQFEADGYVSVNGVVSYGIWLDGFFTSPVVVETRDAG